MKHVCIWGIAALMLACTPTKDPVEQKIDELLSQMTLQEKIGQMNQLNGMGMSDDLKAQIREGRVGSLLNEVNVDVVNEMQRVAVEESRLGIPLIFARDVIHGFKTIFPIPLGQAATWNPEIVEAGARVAAKEATASGIRWTFSPMIDVSRDARWGRIAESYGEDTYINAVMGVATIKGYQTDNLADSTAMAACAKHFCGYGASESGKDYNTTWIPEVQLRDVYLPSFKAAVDAGCATFMCSFNDINGVPSTGSKFLNKRILREEWQYDGLLVTDWGSMQQMIPHGYCSDMKDAAEKAANAAVDMDMMSYGYIDHLEDLVKEGKVSEKTIDEAVRNILRLKFRLGLFENPYTAKVENPYYRPEYLETAKQAAIESTILLKNDNNVLPLSNVTSVAVVGPLSNVGVDQIGTWCFDGEPEKSVTPMQAFQQLENVKVIAEPGLQYSRDKSQAGINKAVAAAKKADVVLCFVGEEAILSGEAKCRADISLPGAQSQLIKELKATGKPLVLVVMAGRPLTMGAEINMADAVLWQFHAGTMAGPALADLIMGKAVPSGKLPVTMPKMVGQVPMYYSHKNTGRPASNITLIDDIPVAAGQFSIGSTSYHLDAGDKPLYPFGYGLSYTSFEYGQPVLSDSVMKQDGQITVTCQVKNIGKYDAYETAQLYTRDLVASLCQPVRQLKGFQKVWIKAGETATVTFTVKPADLAFCHEDMATYAEPGEFHLWVSADSQQGIPVKFVLK
ncbi:MAG: glycoside hydrolase family 3 C-terminal domain-containing protein [Bacteroidetes bacterium]|uniref:beta-glucosidase n=1 Tax=Candidatus Gallipaludibacter merdavium TaxID=2840839 RepID=A0A9D9HT26_9BACT|nr:glycoside hydrolase family 3 C-terminal domain-containing protein [Candidatus Gallipaludibacter merdavium]